jgi:spore maturation protein CgeB
MKILYVGELAPSTRSAQRARALRALGHRLTPISHALESLDGRPPAATLLERACYRLGWPLDLAGLNRQLAAALEQGPYDLLWVECGRTLWPATLAELRWRAPDLPALLFSEDDLFLRHNRSRFQSACLPLYDLVVTTKRRNLVDGELARLGARRVHYEPKSYDPELFKPREVSPAERRAFGAPIGFVGSYEEPRAEALVALAEAGLSVRVFGNGWQRLRGAPRQLCLEGRPLLAREYALSIAASELSLGFLRRKNRDQHTDRSIEIPAAGGLLLAERSSEHQELFAEGREALYFAGAEELVEVARAALADPKRSAAIRRAGRQRVLELDLEHRGACTRILAALAAACGPTSAAAGRAPAADQPRQPQGAGAAARTSAGPAWDGDPGHRLGGRAGLALEHAAAALPRRGQPAATNASCASIPSPADEGPASACGAGSPAQPFPRGQAAEFERP